MSLAPGTRLGPFEVQARLGEGGMGEVYRARDTKSRAAGIGKETGGAMVTSGMKLGLYDVVAKRCRGCALRRKLVISLLIAAAAASCRPAQPTREASPDTSRPIPQDLFAQLNGIRLHYLDWGGEGDVMLFIPGLTHTAHAFDGIAPAFAGRYHVMGITRRGHGASAKPDTGYDLPTLVEDIVAFLNAVGARRAVLVGHSYAGIEMPGVAARLGDRIAGLVFLDALYDWATLDAGPTSAYFTPPDSAFLSRRALDDWHARRFPNMWSSVMATHLRSNTYLERDGRLAWQLRADVQQQLWRTMQQGTDYSGIHAPTLVILANEPEANDENMKAFGYPQADVDTMLNGSRAFVTNKRRGLDALRKSVPGLTLVEMSSPHWVFWHRPAEVTQVMQRFLNESVR